MAKHAVTSAVVRNNGSLVSHIASTESGKALVNYETIQSNDTPYKIHIWNFGSGTNYVIFARGKHFERFIQDPRSFETVVATYRNRYRIRTQEAKRLSMH